MPNRTATFVSAILAASLVSLALITESNSAAQAAESCLSGPKGTPPQGGHWYYRIDRVTKRHCWYVGDAREKLARVSPPSSSPPVKPLSPQTDLATQRPVADAHAELLMPQVPVEQPVDIGAAQRMPAISADAAIRENNQSATSENANTQRLVFASRWPDQSSALSSTNPPPTMSKPVSNVQSQSEAAPVAAAVQLAAADSSSQTRTGSIHTLLLVIVGALALAGIIGRVIFRFGNMRSAGRPDIRDRRRAIRDSADRPLPHAYPRADVPTQRMNDPHDRREANASNDRITEMLSRLSRSAAG